MIVTARKGDDMRSKHSYKIIKNSSNFDSFDFHYFYKDLDGSYAGYSLEDIFDFVYDKLKNVKNYLYLSSIFEKNNDISKIHKINHSVRAFDILSSFAIDRNPKRTIKSSDVKHFKKLLNLDSLYSCVELLSGSLHQASDAPKLYKNANALGCARFIFNDIANFYIDKRNLRDNANSYYYSESLKSVRPSRRVTFVPIFLSLIPIIKSDNFCKKTILQYERDFPFEKYEVTGDNKRYSRYHNYELMIPNIIKCIAGLEVSEKDALESIVSLKEEVSKRYWNLNFLKIFINSFIIANKFDSYSSFIKIHSSLRSIHHSVRSALYSGFIYAGKFDEQSVVKLRADNSQSVQLASLRSLICCESLYDNDQFSSFISKFVGSKKIELIDFLLGSIDPKYRYLLLTNPIARKIGSKYLK